MPLAAILNEELVDRSEREKVQRAMIALAEGCRSEFRPLFDRLWPLLRAFCERALRDAGGAEDAAQTALMKVFLHASNFDPERDAVSWALGFAAHECLSARNWRAGRREDLGDERWSQLPSHALTPEEAVIVRDLREAAIDAVHQLRDDDAEVIEAVVRGERPNASAGVSALFRKRLQRALVRLRVIWRNKYDVD